MNRNAVFILSPLKVWSSDGSSLTCFSQHGAQSALKVGRGQCSGRDAFVQPV
jgi:hypothetical protein